MSLRSPGSTLDQELPDRVVYGLDPLVPAYFRLSGTSMAAPVVTGVVALMLERTPTLTPAQVKRHLMNTAAPLAYGSPDATGSGLVSAVAAVTDPDQSVPAVTVPVSAGFAGDVYPYLYGQPLVWRDPAFNSGVDTNGVAWSAVDWSNVVWDDITWDNLRWESFNWSAVSWQDMTWEGITWEDITWDTVTLKDKLKGRKVRKGWGALD